MGIKIKIDKAPNELKLSQEHEKNLSLNTLIVN